MNMMQPKWIIFFLAVLASVSALALQVSAAPPSEETITGYLQYQEPPEPVPYPITVQILEDGETRTIYKTFTVPDGFPGAGLADEDFDQDGYQYRFREIIHEEQTPGETVKPVVDRVTLELDTDAPEEALALFDPTIPYLDDEGYSGELALIPETITILEAGRTPYSHTVTEVRDYTGLERNDPVLLPQTIFVEGTAIPLKGINWSVGDYQADGSVRYNATASYSGLATGSNVTGYIATAFYGGDAFKPLPVYHTYTVVYEGQPILLEEEPPEAEAGPVIPEDNPADMRENPLFRAMTAYTLTLLILACICGCWSLVHSLFYAMTNASVSRMKAGIPSRPRRVRVKPEQPVLNLRKYHTGARIVIDRRLQQALLERDGLLFVRGRYQNHQFAVSQGLAFALPAQEGPVQYNDETEGGDAI